MVINKEDRPERLGAAMGQFAKFGLNAEVFPALPGGWRGCRDSHLAVLEKYRAEKFLLVFEDDVLFLSEPLPRLMQVVEEELPHGWDMLYLGISPTRKYRRETPHLFRVNGGYTTHAILWHNKPDGAIDYILTHRDEIGKIDNFYSDVIHKRFGCFVIYPMLATQGQYKSDTCKRSDAGSIIRNFNRFCR